MSRVAGKLPLLPMQTSNVLASLRIRAVSQEPLLFAYIKLIQWETSANDTNV